jgi:hypothetical protein
MHLETVLDLDSADSVSQPSELLRYSGCRVADLAMAVALAKMPRISHVFAPINSLSIPRWTLRAVPAARRERFGPRPRTPIDRRHTNGRTGRGTIQNGNDATRPANGLHATFSRWQQSLASPRRDWTEVAATDHRQRQRFSTVRVMREATDRQRRQGVATVAGQTRPYSFRLNSELVRSRVLQPPAWRRFSSSSIDRHGAMLHESFAAACDWTALHGRADK